MNLARILERAATTWGDRPAIAVGADVRHDYRALAAQVARLAGALRGALGLKPGDNVALVLKNGAEYYPLLFACWHAGLAAVPINAKLHAREVAWILDDAKARALFVSEELAHELLSLTAGSPELKARLVIGTRDWQALLRAEAAGIEDRVAADDLAWLFYTSGTTGRPKGAMLTHRNLFLMVMNYFADVDAIAAGDCMIHCAPISHGSGLYGLPHVLRAACNVIPESGGFEPAETLALIARWPGASFFFAPTMVKRLILSPALGGADTRNLKTIVYGGGPMYVADLLAAMRLLGPKLAQIYGQGEAPMTITGMDKAMHVEALGPDPAYPLHPGRLASAGVARSDVEVRVVDDDGRQLPPGGVGEIVVRGPVVMGGYWRNPAATAAAMQGGWLRTGDLGHFDGDGFLTLKDRAKDLIISGGANIYPREVEDVLLEHPGVAEAAVVGRPHADWGEEVVAFIVPRADAAPPAAALDRLCLDRIARFKRPRHYRFVPALPKNNYGKVLKTELRAALSGEGPTTTLAPGEVAAP
jgi:long-chain acyl-CoA synthetase